MYIACPQCMCFSYEFPILFLHILCTSTFIFQVSNRSNSNLLTTWHFYSQQKYFSDTYANIAFFQTIVQYTSIIPIRIAYFCLGQLTELGNETLTCIKTKLESFLDNFSNRILRIYCAILFIHTIAKFNFFELIFKFNNIACLCFLSAELLMQLEYEQ